MNSGEIHHSMDDVFVFTESTATLPKPNLGELTRQLVNPRLNHAICKDELPAGGNQKSFHVEKMNLSTTINPIREDGGMDHRFTGLTNEIVKKAGKECIEDLSRLYQYTNDAEARYEKAGLTLVSSFFQVDMEKWQRRTFLKRLRVWLQEIGFKPSKVSKLITAGEFKASELKRIS